MKKVLLLFLLCNSFCKRDDIIGHPPPHRVSLLIRLHEIKDSRVKSIKITLKNLDGIKPEFIVYDVKKRDLEKGVLEKKSRNIHFNRAKKG